jgi:hypothetical protein
VLRGGALSEAFDSSRLGRGGAGWSCADGSAAVGSDGGRLLSTIEAKLEESCVGSGRAGFGGVL